MFNTYDESKHAITLPKRHALLTALVGILVGGYSASLPAYAAEVKQTLADSAAEDAMTFYTFPGTPKIAISRHGNLVRFEGIVGYEHVESEGYVLCYDTARAWDTGASESGFGPSIPSCSGAKCTVTRNTTDGKLQLKQVITKNPSLDRSLTVEMTLTNLTGTGIGGVVLRRQVNFDVDTGGTSGTGDFENWFASTDTESVFAWNAPDDHASEDHMMILRSYNREPHPTSGSPKRAKVTADSLDATCSPTNIAAAGPVLGDYGATIQYTVGTLGGGKTVVLTAQYQRN